MTESAWTGLHVFYYVDQDKLLVDGIRPLLHFPGCATRTFFLRYWQGGPHVRLRLEAPRPVLDDEVTRVRAGLEAFMRRQPSQAHFEPSAIRSVQEHLARLEGAESEEIVPDNTVRAVPYVPEYAKYGGSGGVEIAETVFTTSASLVHEILPSIRQRPARRSWMALEMLVAGLNALGRTAHEAINFLASYARVWSQYVAPDERRRWHDIEARHRDTIDAVVTRAYGIGEARMSPVSRRWADAVARSQAAVTDEVLAQVEILGPQASAEARRDAILTHILHTHHNRLGLYAGQEALLARLAMGAIARAQGIGACAPATAVAHVPDRL